MPDLTVRKRDLSNITVNGVPLEIVVDEEIRGEIKTHHATELRDMNFVKALHTVSKFRNISHARSGRGRVIYSRANA